MASIGTLSFPMLAASVAENVKQRSRVRLSICPSVFIVFQRYASAQYAITAHCFSLCFSPICHLC